MKVLDFGLAKIVQEGTVMAARIDTAAGVRVVSRRLVVEPFAPPGYDDYHVHPDARSLVLVRPVTRSQEVLMVLDWFTELQRAVAP